MMQFNKQELQAIHQVILNNKDKFITIGVDCDAVDLKNLDKKVRIEIKKIEIEEIKAEE